MSKGSKCVPILEAAA